MAQQSILGDELPPIACHICQSSTNQRLRAGLDPLLDVLFEFSQRNHTIELHPLHQQLEKHFLTALGWRYRSKYEGAYRVYITRRCDGFVK